MKIVFHNLRQFLLSGVSLLIVFRSGVAVQSTRGLTNAPSGTKQLKKEIPNHCITTDYLKYQTDYIVLEMVPHFSMLLKTA